MHGNEYIKEILNIIEINHKCDMNTQIFSLYRCDEGV